MTPSALPPVSLVVVVRDGEAYVREALRSALEQAVPPAQVLVVDDGSQDGTVDAVREFGPAVELHRREAAGAAAGLNHALALVRHGVAAFLDADDLWPQDSLEHRLRALVEGQDAQASGGLTQQFVSPELSPAERARLRLDPSPARAGLLGAMLLRRQAWERVGAFDEGLPLMSNVDWMARARRSGLRVRWVDQVVLRRRLHLRNTSRLRSSLSAGVMLDVVRRHHRAQSSADDD